MRISNLEVSEDPYKSKGVLLSKSKDSPRRTYYT